MPNLFDLFWVYPLISPARTRAKVAIARFSGPHSKTLNSIDTVGTGIPAAILYPALLTPEIMIDAAGERVEILLATKGEISKAELRKCINWQLKIMPGMNANRGYSPDPLFPVLATNDILVTASADLSTGMIRTSKNETEGTGRFWGNLDEAAVEMYKDAGFTKVYAVSMHKSMIPALPLNLPVTLEVNRLVNGKIEIPAKRKNDDNQDWIVSEMFAQTPFGAELTYGFNLAGGDVTIGDTDGLSPVLAWHPLCLYPAIKDIFNVAHIADIHLCGRQQLMQRSTVRVIEHNNAPGQAPLGGVMNICSARASELFTNIANSATLDVTVIGGDLIDFVENIYLNNFHTWKTNQSVKDIWDSLDVRTAQCQVANIDNLSMYSLLLNHYRTSGKPVFAVTGNHDPYHHSFGIAPTVFTKEGKKTNADIAADHNLTWYESVLVFGKHYHVLRKSGSPFDKEYFNWYHALYTPFADFATILPEQIVVGLGWGKAEDILTPGYGQGMGHLPRADEALTADQWTLLDAIATENQNLHRPMILTTHFTFVSYSPSIASDVSSPAAIAPWDGPVYQWDEWTPFGAINPGNSAKNMFGKQDNGTFHNYRKEVYDDTLLDPTKHVQVVLTGHSHRRGVYRMYPQRDNRGIVMSINTHIHDVEEHAGTNGVPPLRGNEEGPLVILSDSGGPHPNFNRTGELNGMGRGKPGGTGIEFDANGDIDTIAVVPTTLLPRFAVSVDYMDLKSELGDTTFEDKDARIIDCFESLEFDPSIANQVWTFVLRFKPPFAALNVPVTALELYYVTYNTRHRVYARHRFPLVHVAGDQWSMNSSAIFGAVMPLSSERATYALIQFGPPPNNTRLHAAYDYTHPWTFEVKVTEDISRSLARSGLKPKIDRTKKFIINRYDAKIRWYPSFDHRENYADYL